MKGKAPPDRRSFVGVRDEAEYLYDKLLYWFDEGQDPARARTYADRLDELLAKESPRHEAIFPEECRSLISEVRGDLPGAIRHRENTVRLTKRLHEISLDRPHWADILRVHGYDYLSLQLNWLAELYHDAGDLAKAIDTLWESKRLCEAHGVAFEGEDLLEDYLEEKQVGDLHPGAG